MDTSKALRNAEMALRQASAKVSTLTAGLEDLTMRAHRIAAARKAGNNNYHDNTYVHDLQVYRRSLITYSQELDALPETFGQAHSAGSYDAAADTLARTLVQGCERLAKMISGLEDSARLAHHHIRNSDAAVEAWYLVQQAEQLSEKGKTVPRAGERMAQRFAAGRPE